jgi:spermidine/putrescine transport system ATP-binding protein
MSADVELDRVTVRFGQFTAVSEASLKIAGGEFFSFLGPSGCGKTTSLRTVSGFLDPSHGAVRIAGQDMTGIGPNKRPTALIFQNLALFPLMTVAENITYGLRVRGIAKAERMKRADELLNLIALPDQGGKLVSELSGGQKQRVAIARALAVEPKVLLLDEPLSALDLKLRQHMRAELRAIQQRVGITFIYITHDQGEALTMSDRIAVFNAGKIEQLAPPEAIYDRPRTRFVAEFIGETNLLRGKIRSWDGNSAHVAIDGGPVVRVTSSGRLQEGTPALISLRPEQVWLSGAPGAVNSIPVTVLDTVYHGDHLRVRMAGDGIELIARVERKTATWTVGTAAHAIFEPDACTLIAQ